MKSAVRTAVDGKSAARSAGLRYVDDRRPGITRVRQGKGVSYRDPDGRRIRDGETLTRIRSLAVPPAWRDVWICADPGGHVQATGRDARGRKQYRYHPRWRAVRDGDKYERMIAFGRALPFIRRRVEKDLARTGLPREKILATVVRLLEVTLIRVGNEEYARHNESFGLATMRDRHVRVNGSALRFEFRGKSGILHAVDVEDRRLARIVRQSRDLPGFELFQYVDAAGERRAIEPPTSMGISNRSRGMTLPPRIFALGRARSSRRGPSVSWRCSSLRPRRNETCCELSRRWRNVSGTREPSAGSAISILRS